MAFLALNLETSNNKEILHPTRIEHKECRGVAAVECCREGSAFNLRSWAKYPQIPKSFARRCEGSPKKASSCRPPLFSPPSFLSDLQMMRSAELTKFKAHHLQLVNFWSLHIDTDQRHPSRKPAGGNRVNNHLHSFGSWSKCTKFYEASITLPTFAFGPPCCACPPQTPAGSCPPGLPRKRT